jgi:signal transduction histidine kinase
MVRNLKHTREQREKTLTELELMNNELENRVMERTQKLLMTNNALNKEKSEQEKLIKELQSTREQLVQSEKMASIGQLSAGIAHEINNPVGFIISNLESLKDQVNDSIDIIEFAKQQADILPTDYQKQFSEKLTDKSYDFLKEDLIDIIEETMEGSQRVKRIVMDLKDYSHFGKHEKESYQINQGIESTLNIIKNQIKYNIDVECELGDIPEVSCCSSEINQVIMNLIVNASQAIEDKGNIIISSEFSNHEVLVKIKDNGCGISEEHLTKIFDPFFTTKPVGTGTGLGLSLSYSIMENNGGKLTVDSTVGVGTTFTLSLPVSDILS